MESREQHYEKWRRTHDQLFSNVRPDDKFTPPSIILIGAMSKAIASLAFALDEDDPAIRHRVFERTIEELERVIDQIQKEAE